MLYVLLDFLTIYLTLPVLSSVQRLRDSRPAPGLGPAQQPDGVSGVHTVVAELPVANRVAAPGATALGSAAEPCSMLAHVPVHYLRIILRPALLPANEFSSRPCACQCFSPEGADIVRIALLAGHGMQLACVPIKKFRYLHPDCRSRKLPAPNQARQSLVLTQTKYGLRKGLALLP